MSCDPIRKEPAPGRPPPLEIGGLSIRPPVLQAPMSSLTNLPMRTLAEEAGCGLTVTEFLAAPALAAGVRNELDKLQPSAGDRAFAVQIFGRHPEQMQRAARVAADRGADIVDLNMGCPARKVTKGVAGAALMREPALAAELVQAVHEGVRGEAAVTVKMRAGWDDEHKNAPVFAQQMVAAGAEAITVHGRTREQGFSGRADLEIIAEVKQALEPLSSRGKNKKVPLIGNGDIKDAASCACMFEQTGCDGVMIGRAALGNPWVFSVCARWWQGLPPPEPPTLAERLRMYLRHLDLYLEIAETRRAVFEMRKFAGWYLKGFPGAASLRKVIYGLTDVPAIYELVRTAAEEEPK